MRVVLDAPAKAPKRTWGGKREGAGRKKVERRRSVAHRARPVHKKWHPAHVTLRAKGGLPSFRAQRVHRMLRAVIERQPGRRYGGDFQVVHYTIQSNHLHIIAEATDKRMLRSGVSGLVIAFAKRLNALLERSTGKVWGDRYHARDLETPREVRNAISYLFQNYKKHGVTTYGAGIVDHYSSALRFNGWGAPIVSLPQLEPWPGRKPRTWLLGEGWTTHGLLHPNERPANR